MVGTQIPLLRSDSTYISHATFAARIYGAPNPRHDPFILPVNSRNRSRVMRSWSDWLIPKYLWLCACCTQSCTYRLTVPVVHDCSMKTYRYHKWRYFHFPISCGNHSKQIIENIVTVPVILTTWDFSVLRFLNLSAVSSGAVIISLCFSSASKHIPLAAQTPFECALWDLLSCLCPFWSNSTVGREAQNLPP